MHDWDSYGRHMPADMKKALDHAYGVLVLLLVKTNSLDAKPIETVTATVKSAHCQEEK